MSIAYVSHQAFFTCLSIQLKEKKTFGLTWSFDANNGIIHVIYQISFLLEINFGGKILEI